MSNLIFVGDIVEANGKTIKENNLGVEHKIPVGALVETTSAYEYGWEGMRLFVREHTRDCDGTPLYSLGDNELAFVLGFGEDNLKVL